MHKAGLDEGNLNSCRIDIIFAQLGEVEVVRINWLLILEFFRLLGCTTSLFFHTISLFLQLRDRESLHESGLFYKVNKFFIRLTFLLLFVGLRLAGLIFGNYSIGYKPIGYISIGQVAFGQIAQCLFRVMLPNCELLFLFGLIEGSSDHGQQNRDRIEALDPCLL